MPFLYAFVILLLAAIIAVPLAKRFGFGSVLGYLAAGLVIGPAGLRLVTDVESIQQVSSLGVVMLLFLIGLEIRPRRLWTLRRSVLGLGAAQVVATTAALAAAAHLAGLAWSVAFVVGFGLSLSSTAKVLPMLAERDLLTTHAGRDSFAVLLFQDIAVIPAVALIPVFQGGGSLSASDIIVAVTEGAAALVIVLIGGRYLVRPIFKLVDSAKTPEIFTATALVIVAGTAALVNAANLSMSLGAFIAGVLLSDSEYRHEIRADIEPFEGLLLGVFFISVGMATNLGLLGSEPGFVLGAVAALFLIKSVIAFVLARVAGQVNRKAMRFSFALAQAGEFAFVLFGAAVASRVMTQQQSELAALVITLSMLASPFLFWFEERFLGPLFERSLVAPFDSITARNDVIIAGFGRVGQIVGRILRMRGIPFTALDKSAEQIDIVRRFGSQAYYGDSTRLDLLRSAGAAEARILVVALEEVKDSLQVVEHAQRHFPQLVIFARARNRRHAHLLMDRGVTRIIRETYYSSLRLSENVMLELGVPLPEAERTVKIFQERDEQLLIDSHSFYQDEKQMIQTTKQITDELQSLLEGDQARAEAG